MTAARKLAPPQEQDPVLEALRRAPVERSPAPEQERAILDDPSSMQFVPALTVSRQIAAR